MARGYAACDGGGRWRVYGTRVAAVGDGPVEVVLGRRLGRGARDASTRLMPEQKLGSRRAPGVRVAICGDSTGSARRGIARRTCARLVWLTSYRTGQVVRYVGADDGDA